MVGKMNAPNVDFHDGLLINSNNNQLFMGQQQEIWSNMGTAARLESAKPPSSCIVSRFESPASAFYATERYMGLQQYDHHFSGSHQDSSQLQQLMKQSSNYSVYRRRNQLEQLDFKPFQSNMQDEKMQVGVPISQMGFQSRHDQNDLSPGGGGGGGSMGSGAGLSNKTRIRWTQDLHEKFVECVNRLGGADKATPKAILKLMDSEGLTIFHVKSHLQKYRIAKYMPDTSEGKADRRSVINDVSQLDPKAGFQIREAHQLQLDVQRRLHEQLEIQRNLQVRIEEQSKQLKMMFDHQQQSKNSSSSSSNNNNSNSNNLWGAFNVTTTTTSSNFQDGHHEPVFTGVVEVSVAPEEGSENVNFPTKIS